MMLTRISLGELGLGETLANDYVVLVVLGIKGRMGRETLSATKCGKM